MSFRRVTNSSAILLVFLAGSVLCVNASAKVIGMNRIAQPVTQERIAKLPHSQKKAWREYLERSEKQKQIDKDTLQAEMKAANVTESKAAPNGRNAFGLGIDQPADWYTSPDALRMATNVVSYQVADGGWSKNIDMTSNPRVSGGRYDTDNTNRYTDPADFDKPVDEHWHYIATLDNDSTYMQIRFLAHVTAALLAAHRDTEAETFRSSVQRGVEYLLESQYPNGGWPQVWPMEGGYHDAITQNDDAMLHAIEVLQDVGDNAADYNYLPAAMRKRAAVAAKKGIARLLSLQIMVNGKRTAWAQQYDALTYEPTAGRNYEMASIASDESIPIVEFLMQLPNPTAEEVASVHAAADWFTATEIFGYRFGSGNNAGDRSSPDGRKLVAVAGAGPIWARYYQIGTNLPIFGDRDKTIRDDVNELSRERRNGYSWYNAEAVGMLAEYKTWAQSHPK
jgi:PelA/Pel-15E family pectate lyase